MGDNLQVAFPLSVSVKIKEDVTVVSVSADRSRPRGFSERFMFSGSSKLRLNRSRANYGASDSYYCLDLVEFLLRLRVRQTYESCRASWISSTHAVFVCVASGFAQILDMKHLGAQLQTLFKARTKQLTLFHSQPLLLSPQHFVLQKISRKTKRELQDELRSQQNCTRSPLMEWT